MRKLILAAGVLCLMALADRSTSQTGEYRTLVLSGTADTIIDSTITNTFMGDKRLFINGIYWWYDNAANTNQMFVQVASGAVNLATNLGRSFKYSEAMTSSGIKGTAMTLNVSTSADSTVYFVISGTGSDSLFMAVNYRFIGK